MKKCRHCSGDIEIRNPKGFCDHLHYPDNCKVCMTLFGDMPAFPQTIDDMGTMRSVTQGMSLRDWFAGQALLGILASCPGGMDLSIDYIPFKIWARSAYRQADDMLKARERKL